MNTLKIPSCPDSLYKRGELRLLSFITGAQPAPVKSASDLLTQGEERGAAHVLWYNSFKGPSRRKLLGLGKVQCTPEAFG